MCKIDRSLLLFLVNLKATYKNRIDKTQDLLKKFWKTSYRFSFFLQKKL